MRALTETASQVPAYRLRPAVFAITGGNGGGGSNVFSSFLMCFNVATGRWADM